MVDGKATFKNINFCEGYLFVECKVNGNIKCMFEGLC
jgi:hypothetical protein